MISLRPYQSAAVESVYRHLRDHDDNPVVVIPTGGGKTPVMATICDDAVRKWDGRVLVLAHVKELLEQTAGTLRTMAPELDVGVYSAGLRRRDTQHPVIVAGIQSVYKRAGDLFGEQAFQIILIDEAHMIPPEGDGMYRQFLADAKVINPQVRTIGLTATPFRMTSGSICQGDHFLNSICYEVSVKELIRDGYLCPLRTKAAIAKVDTSNLHVRAGEFIASETEELMDQDNLVRAACVELVQQTQDRQSVLIFASGVQHGLHIAENLRAEHGVECGFVCGETPVAERDRLIGRFRRSPGQGLFGDSCQKPLKYLCNVNVLTTGFDAPNVDCIAMLRPTMSPGLYYQMVGRGFRLCEGKADCLVLDFGGNVMRHGPVDDLRVTEPGAASGEAPAKECPQCHAVIHAAYATCPQCGYAFPPPQRQGHDAEASTEGVLSGQETVTEYPVTEVRYAVHVKRDAPQDAPRTMRAEYRIGWQKHISEWVCFDHTGYARAKAENWWRQRSNDPVPSTVEEAVALAEAGSLAKPSTIQVRHVAGEPYDRIIGHQLGEKPPALTEGDLSEPVPEPEPVYETPLEDIPF
jgi:DNA repair protein RadD